MSYYKSGHWNKLRLAALRRDKYTCQQCSQLCLGKKKGGVSPHVDHIEPRPRDFHAPTSYDVIGNLVTLCAPCHNKKTAWEDNSDKPEIFTDGFPADSDWR